MIDIMQIPVHIRYELGEKRAGSALDSKVSIDASTAARTALARGSSKRSR